MPQYPLRHHGMMPPGYETTARTAAGPGNLVDGARIEKRADGSTRITLPDPPHWTRGTAPSTRTPERRRTSQQEPRSATTALARNKAALELRRRQLALLTLTGAHTQGA